MEPFPEQSASDEISWAERIPDSHPDPEAAFAEKETFQWVDKTLTKMSPLLREAFTMTYHDEMSSEEAGDLLGVAAGTFKSRVFRARQDLMNQAERAIVAPLRRAGRLPISAREDDFSFVGAKTMAAHDISLTLSPDR